MSAPPRSSSRAVARRSLWRRLHRWLGIVALAFVLVLALTGIALNHGDDWRLDERYVAWSWVLAAYGIEAPPPVASFAGGGHRATLLGERVYFDGGELARGIAALAGTVAVGDLVAVAAEHDVFLLTAGGELVERIPVTAQLPGTIDALGVADGRIVVASGGALFRFDAELLGLEPWPDGSAGDVRWSQPSPAGESELAAIRDHYRGRGVTVERLLADLHSGRLFTRAGVLVMDAAAVLLIVLALTGLWLWLRRGNGRRPPPP